MDKKEKIRNTSSIKAKKYLLNEGFYPEEFVLPPFYKSNLNKLKFKKIKFETETPPIDDSPLTFCVHTDDNYGWRKFGLIHPFIYWHIVNEFTEEKSWESLLKFFNEDRGVISYTIPNFQENRVKNGILRWGEMEDDILLDSCGYKYLVSADIKSFYSSIYTHSISWALHGKDNIRKGYKNISKNGKVKKIQNRFNLEDFLGNRLDLLFRNSNGGQTKGIFVGPLITEVVAEIISLAIDKNIYLKTKAKKIDCKLYRYRDDYRFLCKSSGDRKKILNTIMNELDRYNLELNNNKTESFEIISDGVIRPWVKETVKIIGLLDIFEINGNKKIKNLKIIMSMLLDLQKKYPKSNILMTFMNRLNKNGNFDIFILHKDFSKKEAKQLLNQLLSLSVINKSVFRNTSLFITKILEYHFKKKNEKVDILLKLLEQSILEESIYEFIWAVYLFKYFDIRQKLPIKLLKKEKMFSKEPGYGLLKSLISTEDKGFTIFNKISKDDNKIKNIFLLDKNFIEQRKRKIIEKSTVFSYSGNNIS